MWSVILASAALAQSPEEPWETIETEHFRLHYPTDTREWALYAGQRLDAIRSIVSEEVGYAPPQRVEIVVMDPFAQANGFALPLTGGPRMGIFPTAPDPASIIGHYRTWAEDLIVHEDAHLTHLLRPSRNTGLSLAYRYLGIGPLSLNCPAWVVEGYATVVEGRLTGLGRPNSNGRAAFLRSLALDGDFPEYSELDLPERYSAGSYRYLVGSAYLEWLVARTHEGALRDLWARMTASEVRNFSEAFIGVFGDEPEALYRRFVAELTYGALAIEQARPEDAETLYQDFSGSASAPDVSPDGSQLVLLQRGSNGPPRLVVYPTDPGDAPRVSWEEDNLPDLEADPEDVAPVPPRAYPIEPAAEVPLGGRRPAYPRWLDDDTILFTDFRLGASGDAHPELFTWTVSTNEIRPVTRNAHVRDADPRDGVAYALRARHGLSSLVSVSMETGAVTVLTEVRPETVVAQPRVSADGSHLAWVANRGAGWQIEWAPLEAGSLGEIVVADLPEGAEVVTVSWDPDGALLATLGRGGFLEAYTVSLDGDWQQLTHSRHGALYPVATPDNSAIFYLGSDSEGLDLHRLKRAAAQETTLDDAEVRERLRLEAPVLLPPRPAPAPALEIAEVEPHRYRARPQLRPMVGEVFSGDQDNLELGLSAVDIVGRNELAAFASLGDRMLIGSSGRFQFRGARLSYTSRRFPVRIRLDGAYQDFNGVAPQFFLTAHGQYSRQWTHGSLQARLGAVGQTNTLEVLAAPEVRLTAVQRKWVGPMWLGVGTDSRVMVDLIQLGEQTWRTEATVGAGVSKVSVNAEAEYGTSSIGFVLGGVAEPLLPDPAAAASLWAPGLPYGLVTQSEDVLRYRAEVVAMGAVQVFGERHVMDAGALPYTRAGAALSTALPSQPLVGTPGLLLELGLSCLLEQADGWAAQACRSRDDWSGWLTLQLRPGEEFQIP